MNLSANTQPFISPIRKLRFRLLKPGESYENVSLHLFILFYFLGDFASVPRDIPVQHYDSYSMGGEIPVIDYYIDQSGGETKLHWPKK